MLSDWMLAMSERQPTFYIASKTFAVSQEICALTKWARPSSCTATLRPRINIPLGCTASSRCASPCCATAGAGTQVTPRVRFDSKSASATCFRTGCSQCQNASQLLHCLHKLRRKSRNLPADEVGPAMLVYCNATTAEKHPARVHRTLALRPSMLCYCVRWHASHTSRAY